MIEIRGSRESTIPFLGGLALLLALGGPAAATTPPAQIAVSPSRFELEIGPRPTTESIKVMNMGREEVEIAVSTASWDLDEANSVRLIPPDEQSLEQWIAINPLRFTIPAGRSQTVRFSIRPRVLPAPGEHRAMIYFNQMLPESTETNLLRVKFAVGVAIYGMAGEVTRVGRLHEVRPMEGTNPVAVRFDISSEGNAHVRLTGQYAIYPADSGIERASLWSAAAGTSAVVVDAGLLPGRPVLADTRRAVLLQTATTLPPGEYVLDLRGELAGRPVERTVPFSIAPTQLLAGSPSDAPRRQDSPRQ